MQNERTPAQEEMEKARIELLKQAIEQRPDPIVPTAGMPTDERENPSHSIEPPQPSPNEVIEREKLGVEQ